MDNLIAARGVFGMSLSFHIMFAALGVVMPFFLLLSQGLYLKKKDPVYLALNKKWTTAFAITYAIGAVSGTVLTFGLGLFWPRFMDFAGPMIGVPLSIEVMFFLLEAIFLGIYLFGRDLLSPWVHWLSAVPLLVGGFASMVVVILANSWMNTPVGFTLDEAGQVADVEVFRAMFSPSWYAETSHMTVAAFEAVGFAFAAIYAWGMIRGRHDEYHKKGFFMGMIVVTLAAPLMIFSGDHTARQLAANEPAKLAAIEPLYETEAGAGISIGGIPDNEAGEVKYDIEIPYMLSILSYDDPNATVQGLNEFPEDERPNPLAMWWAYDAMTGIGFFLAALIPVFWIFYWRYRGVPTYRPLLYAITLSGFLGFLAIELGWLTTEEGRQPWVAQGVMRIEEGYTLAPGIGVAFIAFALLYLFLASTLIWLLKRIATGAPPEEEVEEAQRQEESEGAYAL
ncbi:MAG: Cytochrome bd terminal oxidase subunit I [uncultured Rubrobacteraceae bacterium]|uniref:Cytochrome bd terminal oxidase subunit I n=1 Tax=uncultured Rubrobacteraceae bacterium TaxID=349277 RepID=A0A6J4QLV8_9ACTN|nr:MAG: Cytochrome bd terminal oxidase subunit I [uncultured Rubrobacteraceae bacterium]